MMCYYIIQYNELNQQKLYKYTRKKVFPYFRVVYTFTVMVFFSFLLNKINFQCLSRAETGSLRQLLNV